MKPIAEAKTEYRAECEEFLQNDLVLTRVANLLRRHNNAVTYDVFIGDFSSFIKV